MYENYPALALGLPASWLQRRLDLYCKTPLLENGRELQSRRPSDLLKHSTLPKSFESRMQLLKYLVLSIQGLSVSKTFLFFCVELNILLSIDLTLLWLVRKENDSCR